MGVAFKDLIPKKELEITDLNNKAVAVDSYNMLYQFLTTIRGRDGQLLMDSNGNVTSHLVGLFSRTIRFMENGIKLVFVMDGKAPKLKEKERERRKAIKIEAEKAHKKAVEKEDIEAMKKYAARTTRLTPDLVDEAKKLITALGLPIVQAPSEGEAQAAYLVKNNDCYAVSSQDFDALIHQATYLIRNLSIAGKRKRTNKLAYETIKPELISLGECLNSLGIDADQLTTLAMLIGTDYNIGGIKGIGPKNALKLVKQHNKDFDSLFREVKWDDHFSYPWTEVYYQIKKMPVSKDYTLKWKPFNEEDLKRLLVDKHDFSEERVDNSLEKLNKAKEEKKQKGLGDFL